MTTRGRFLAIVGGSVVCGAKRRDDGWHHAHGPNGLSIATASPLDLTFAGLDGEPFRLADHRGRVVVVNLFATWCGPCRAEAADLAAFAGAHTADTVVVSVDVGETADKARRFADTYGIAYALAVDEPAAIAAAIGMREYPTTLFVRPSGRLACAFVGQLSRADLEAERRNALA